MNPLVTSVIHTLAFYDAVGKVPLTKLELYKYLISTKNLPLISFGVFSSALEEEWPVLRQYIAFYRGFYFLGNNSAGYKKRIDIGKTGVRKWRIAKRMARAISFLPYVRMVGVTGSLALHTTNTKSDIDVLVVVKAGHIWTARVLVSFLMHVLGKRRHGNKIQDRICLNHYIADSDLALRPKNLFSAHIYATFVPVWSRDKTKEMFVAQNHPWIKSYLPHAGMPSRTDPDGIVGRSFFEHIIPGEVAEKIEALLKNLQARKIQHTFANQSLGEGEVIFDDTALVFHHPRPRRQEALYLYRENLRELGIE